jgi:hypothetical protein
MTHAVRSRSLALLMLCALLLTACEDAPTVPEAIQRLAGGEDWVAVSAPVELPRISTWLGYISADTPAGQEARSRVQELERLAREARKEGRVSMALELGREAERIVLFSLERAPEPAVLQNALQSLDFWSDRVHDRFDLTHFPELSASVLEVMARRTRAADLLASGDTTSAVLEIAASAHRIREHTPEAVALRVLSRAEERVGSAPLEAAAAERAVHLLATARQELIAGDPRRALHRALYALQIVEGSEVRMVRSGDDPACQPAGC